MCLSFAFQKLLGYSFTLGIIAVHIVMGLGIIVQRLKGLSCSMTGNNASIYVNFTGNVYTQLIFASPVKSRILVIDYRAE